MLRTPDIQQSARFALSDPMHQLFITHCLRDEGVYGEAGFTVRAASTLDPLVIRFALESPRPLENHPVARSLHGPTGRFQGSRYGFLSR